jgi:hypothetical protein
MKSILHVSSKALFLVTLCLFLNACSQLNIFNPTVTKEKYDNVKTGMTRTEVEKIVGKPGETTSDFSFEIPGLPNSPIKGEQAFYQWKNEDGSTMNAMFVNGKLLFKTQSNLK